MFYYYDGRFYYSVKRTVEQWTEDGGQLTVDGCT